MRSKTSYFNFTLFWKNITRFWPLWVVYGVIWLVAIPMRGLNDLRQGWWSGGTYGFNRDMLESVAGMGTVMAAVFGVLFAMALFSYLYQGRSACMIHSLPIRREGLFLTNYLAGVAFFVVPNTVVALLTLLVELMAGDVFLWGLAMWWLTLNGLCLFFFSFAVFCAMFTGHILALPAFYAILNILVYGVSELVTFILSLSLFGFNGFSGQEVQRILTPVWGMMDAAYWDVYVETDVVMGDPVVFALYVLAGLAFAAAALLLYRRRQMETAGDVVSVSWVRPVFKYGVALCSGLAFGTGTWSIVGMSGQLSLWICIILWAVIGYFAAEMILKKSFRVLRSWKGGAAVALVVLVCCAGVSLDVFGYGSRVPQAGQVTGVLLTGLDSMPFDTGSNASVYLEGPEQIAEVIALHQAIVDKGEETDADQVYLADGNMTQAWITVIYDLEGGGRMSRCYPVTCREDDLTVPGTTAYIIQQLLNDRTVIPLLYGLDQYKDYSAELAELTSTDSEYGTVSVAEGEDAQALWQAVLQDFEEGNLGRRYLFDTEERLEYCYYNDLYLYLTTINLDQNGERYTSSTNITVTLTPGASHTLGVLRELGVLDQVELKTYGEVIYEDGLTDWQYDPPVYEWQTGDLPSADLG